MSLKNISGIVIVGFFAFVVSFAAAETETDYLAIFMEGQKVGHAVHTRMAETGKVTTTDGVSMTLGRGGQAVNDRHGSGWQSSHFPSSDGPAAAVNRGLACGCLIERRVAAVTAQAGPDWRHCLRGQRFSAGPVDGGQGKNRGRRKEKRC
jgi:hypothetical protein